MTKKQGGRPLTTTIATDFAAGASTLMAAIYQTDPDDPGPPEDASPEEVWAYRPKRILVAKVVPKMFDSEAEAVEWHRENWPFDDPDERGKGAWAHQQRTGQAAVGVSDRPISSFAEIHFPAVEAASSGTISIYGVAGQSPEEEGALAPLPISNPPAR